MKDMNLPIARKCFAVLYLDSEYNADSILGLESFVYCRVVVDGWYKDSISAATREEAIEKFYNGDWRH